MGQAKSSLKSTLIFAYLDNPEIAEAIKTDSPEKDCLLLYPEIYGLKSNVSLNTKNTKRPDSGFISTVNTGNLILLRDLAYIDYTYYSTWTPSVTSFSIPHHHNDISINTTHGPTHISFADALLTSPDKSYQEIYLTNRGIRSLSSNISMLSTIRRLDLSNNHITELPDFIGCMRSLEYLSVSRNQITSLPATIGYLSNLLELDVSYNRLDSLTPSIGHLNKLKSFTLSYNSLQQLPIEIGRLVNLIALDLSRNPLRVLPAEVSKLPFLRRMLLEECPLYSELRYPMSHHPVSLMETCARTVVRHQIDSSSLPDRLIQYIQTAKPCSSCGGPYFESCVLRGRWIEKSDLQIPLEYILCSAHWSDADDRMLSMFSTQPETTTQHPIQLLSLPKLTPPAGPTTIDRLGSLTRQTRYSPASVLESGVLTEASEDRTGSHRLSLLKQHARRRLNKPNIADWASKMRGQRQV
ncbi:hypothetical protein EDC96DRAFT_498357 [Choanephora cucurbitarum]|nr:hypothetical protein EDC96DRAFT_498357 [Choanephora cucurbitarum]